MARVRLSSRERAVAATVSRDPIALDTLAAAYAEAGQFDRASTVARQALALVPEGSSPGLEGFLRAHIGLFGLKRAIRSSEW